VIATGVEAPGRFRFSCARASSSCAITGAAGRKLASAHRNRDTRPFLQMPFEIHALQERIVRTASLYPDCMYLQDYSTKQNKSKKIHRRAFRSPRRTWITPRARSSDTELKYNGGMFLSTDPHLPPPSGIHPATPSSGKGPAEAKGFRTGISERVPLKEQAGNEHAAAGKRPPAMG